MLRTEQREGVLIATLSRPPVNALNGELVSRMAATLKAAIADETIRVVHWRAEGRVFCAGADLALMRKCFQTADGPGEMMEVVRQMQDLFASVEAAPVLSIAELGGTTVGGGLEFALACDLRIAAQDARIGLTEASLGLLPGAGGTQRLTRLCGRGIATRLILGAEVVEGVEAERLGVVNWALPREQLAEFAAATALRLAGVPRVTIAANKSCIALGLLPGEAGFTQELTCTRQLYEDAEIRRRVGAFLDKTK
ncbi:MAG: enoyl-CoA hydratase/isomerase family protein [Alphaproteobacteria bacterium]|nr:enoyl-CoA hydratase/isomerase family protein [Alphaproteobacteria bacterium]